MKTNQPKAIAALAIGWTLATLNAAHAAEMDCMQGISDCALGRTYVFKLYPEQPISRIGWRAEASFAISYRGEVQSVVYETSRRTHRDYEETEHCVGYDRRYPPTRDCHRRYLGSEHTYGRSVPRFHIEETAGGFESTVSADASAPAEAQRAAMRRCRMERKRMVDLYPACSR